MNFHQIIFNFEIGFVIRNSIVQDLNSSAIIFIQIAGIKIIKNQISKSK